jgi:Flavodoxin-like fold/Cupin
VLKGRAIIEDPETKTARELVGGGIVMLPHGSEHVLHDGSGHTPLKGALDLSEMLIQEVEAADVIVIGTPMHNLTVPSVLKAWIDRILRAGRTFKSTPAGKVGMLRVVRCSSASLPVASSPATGRTSPIFSRRILRLCWAPLG